MYIPYLMLRNLGPQAMTGAEQRRADEELGKVAAALTRTTRSVAARAHAAHAAHARRPAAAAAFRIRVRASSGHYDR